MPIENTNPTVRREGLKTNKAVVFGSTLSVIGTATLAVIVLTGALTGTTAVFTGVIESESSVSSTDAIINGTTFVDSSRNVSAGTVSSTKVYNDSGSLQLGESDGELSQTFLMGNTEGLTCFRMVEGTDDGTTTATVWLTPTAVTPFFSRNSSKPAGCT